MEREDGIGIFLIALCGKMRWVAATLLFLGRNREGGSRACFCVLYEGAGVESHGPAQCLLILISFSTNLQKSFRGSIRTCRSYGGLSSLPLHTLLTASSIQCGNYFCAASTQCADCV